LLLLAVAEALPKQQVVVEQVAIELVLLFCLKVKLLKL
jgi:hypothetical protein